MITGERGELKESQGKRNRPIDSLSPLAGPEAMAPELFHEKGCTLGIKIFMMRELCKER